MLSMFPPTAVLGTVMAAVAGPFVESDTDKILNAVKKMEDTVKAEHKHTRLAIE